MERTRLWLRNFRLAQKFDYKRPIKDLWFEVLSGGKDVFDVGFDTENNEAVADPFTMSVGKAKFVCEPYFACGDWQNPVLYYRCQFKEGLGTLESFGTEISQYRDPFFVFIPEPEDGNPNLAKPKKGDRRLVATEGEEDRGEPSDRKGRKALKAWLKENLKD